MMQRLLQLNSTQINRFDSSIGLNVIDWANATKTHTPPSAKHYFPP